eukprot:TRINITY_DN22263_c0_g1_i1.p1 TRINITY_DN22263_c0_g1~~TRINITY_DN22263_c0_g1_i1.p1  ORF type:complete len:296 (+),score=63.95 TRINITY_DN22263_c0_g1_i1:128-889(+)
MPREGLLREYVQRGVVHEPHRAFLAELTADLLAADHSQPCHVMAYGYGAPTPPVTLLLSAGRRAQLLAIAGALARGFSAEARLLSVRLLVAPPGAGAQQWHLDYRSHAGLNTRTVFAAMTPATEENCTEMLVPADRAAADNFERRVEAVESRDEMPQVAVPAANFQPMSLLLDTFEVACVATSRLPHRRGPTGACAAGRVRVTLNVDYTECSEAALQRIGFLDDDSVTASASGGVVGRAVVDDLHSEIVVCLT